MPRPFTRCVSSGGRVRTMRRGKGKIQKICFKGGKSFVGHVKKGKRKR